MAVCNVNVNNVNLYSASSWNL